MSFQFDWPQRFPPSFVATAKNALEQALNAGQKLSLVADRIRVVDLNMGSIPPELDILSLDELSGVDASFRGTFMLSYSGDALISLAANLHVNPLTQYKHALEMLATPSVLLTTAEMFVQLTLSHLRLRCVIALSFSKSTGLTLAFKDDPLESLNVSSSFDSFGVVQQFIQSEIENQLRERFRRDLPSLIHRLSQRWCADMAQQSSLHEHAPIVVEQGMHHRRKSSSSPSLEAEPDESLPYDQDGHFLHAQRLPVDYADTSYSTGPADQSSDAVYQLETEQSEVELGEERHVQNGAVPLTSVSPPATRSELSWTARYGTSQPLSMANSAPGDDELPSSWTSISSLGSQATSPSSERAVVDSITSSLRRYTRQPSEPDSSILSSLQRSGSAFATTFSKPSVALSARELQSSLDRPEITGTSNMLANSSVHPRKITGAASLGFGVDSSVNGAPQATRKRFHRIENVASPKNSPHASPRKSRALREAKSRDKLRLGREDLDEYFPVSEEGSSASKAPALSPREALPLLSRPSLLNPDIPVHVPMTASLLHSGRSEFPTKNSLRRTMMSSRLKERERDNIGLTTSRRPGMDPNFFTDNKFR